MSSNPLKFLYCKKIGTLMTQISEAFKKEHPYKKSTGKMNWSHQAQNPNDRMISTTEGSLKRWQKPSNKSIIKIIKQLMGSAVAIIIIFPINEKTLHRSFDCSQFAAFSISFSYMIENCPLVLKKKFRIGKNSLKSLRGWLYVEKCVQSFPLWAYREKTPTHVVMPSLADPSLSFCVWGMRGLSAGGF